MFVIHLIIFIFVNIKMCELMYIDTIVLIDFKTIPLYTTNVDVIMLSMWLVLLLRRRLLEYLMVIGRRSGLFYLRR